MLIALNSSLPGKTLKHFPFQLSQPLLVHSYCAAHSSETGALIQKQHLKDFIQQDVLRQWDREAEADDVQVTEEAGRERRGMCGGGEVEPEPWVDV